MYLEGESMIPGPGPDHKVNKNRFNDHSGNMANMDSRTYETKEHGTASTAMTKELITGTSRAVPCPDLVDPCRAKYFRAVPS